jgi:hypothetical protein
MADMAAIREAAYARRMENIPEGFHLVAVREATLGSGLPWRLEADSRCRAGAGPRAGASGSGSGRPGCGKPSAAAINRGTLHHPRWFAYCPAHMYGRWIEAGQVMCWILEAHDA